MSVEKPFEFSGLRCLACLAHLVGPQMQEQDVLAEVENGKASFHDSGSSLTNRPSPGVPAGEDPTGTNCWDIDASDIVICQRPDGDKWLLNTSESGEVYLPVLSIST